MKIIFYMILLSCILNYKRAFADIYKIDHILDDDIHLSKLYLDNHEISEAFEIYKIDAGIYIPFADFIRILDFPINIDLENKKIEGWYISEKYKIEIDLNKNYIKLGGKTRSINKSDYFINNSEIYIKKEIIEILFKAKIIIDSRKSEIKTSFDEKLPFQKHIERQQQWKINSKISNNSNNIENPTIQTHPYQLFTVPSADINLSKNYSNQTKESLSEYSILAANDLLYFNTSSFITGNSNKIQDIRFTAFRKNYDNSLGNQFSNLDIGDINPSSRALISILGTGRGINLNNNEFGKDDQFDITSFSGYASPGWQVSLYRNNSFIAYKQIENNGYYQFNNIPIIYGNNEFKIILYGPQGEIIEKRKNISASNNILKKGKYNYNISIDQKNSMLFESLIDKRMNKNSKYLRKILNFDYGVSNKITVNSSIISTPIIEKNYKYYGLGIKTSIIPGSLLSIDHAYDIDNRNYANRISGLTKLLDTSIRVDFSRLNNFKSEEYNSDIIDQSNYIQQVSELDLSRIVNIFHQFNLGFNIKNTKRNNGMNEQIITNTVSTSVKNSNITNNLYLNRTSNDKVTGDINISNNILSTSSIFGMNYNITRKDMIKTIYFSGQKNMFKDYSVLLDFNKNLGQDKLSILSASIIKDYTKYRLSIKGQIDNNRNLSIGCNLSLSITREPLTRKIHTQSNSLATIGSSSTTLFIDKNYNNQLDEGEEIVRNFNIRNKSYEFENSNQYTRLSSNHSPYLKSSISIDDQSIKDLSLQMNQDDYNIITRPGIVMPINIPVVAVSEIEGKLYIKDGDNIQEVSDIDIDLISDKIIKKKTEFDSYYIFEKIKPGIYKIRINSFKYNDRYTNDYEEEIEIKTTNDIYNHDIYLSYK